MSLFLAIGVTAIAAGFDLRSGRIPNALTYSALLIGVGLGFAPAAEIGWDARLLGLAVAFVPSFVLFLAHSLGGGDVKLLAAVGALVGYPLVLDVLFWTIAVGTAWSLLVLVRSGRLIETLRHLAVLLGVVATRNRPGFVPATDLRIPFGAAILVAVVCAVLVPALRVAAPGA